MLTGPCGKFVSKNLKSLIKATPTIIHGTKDLVLKLSKLQLPSPSIGYRYYIVTGDVVAFYPNIPLKPCLDIVEQMWLEHTFPDWITFNDKTESSRGYEGSDERVFSEVFKRSLRVSSSQLVTQYQNEYYLQLRGLAMGVPESPDLANLYGWHFEKNAGVLTDRRIAFYGRYIDDCFAIVAASSGTDATQYMNNKLSFDGCEIKWETGALRAVFLDATFHLEDDHKGQNLHWEPYRKPGNHMERIPWISGHPRDVKRGTFIGEMSRLAVLSSKFTTYLEAIKGLVALYVKRGYPRDLVTYWVKQNLQVRWEKRLSEKDDTANDEGVLVLKSHYNPAWNYFHAKELGDTIFNYWRAWYEKAERGEARGSPYEKLSFPRPSRNWGAVDNVEGCFLTEVPDGVGGTLMIPDIRKLGLLDRRMIVSRKRTRNLFDLTNLWKKLVLLEVDENEAADRISEIQLPGNTAAGSETSGDARIRMRIEHRENIHRRSPSPNKPMFG